MYRGPPYFPVISNDEERTESSRIILSPRLGLLPERRGLRQGEGPVLLVVGFITHLAIFQILTQDDQLGILHLRTKREVLWRCLDPTLL